MIRLDFERILFIELKHTVKSQALNYLVRCAFGIFQFSRCLTLPSLGSRMQNPRLGDAGNKLFMSLLILDWLLWNEYFVRNSTEPNFYLVRFMRPEAIEAWVGVKGGEEVECAQVSCFVLSCISYVSFICNPSPPPPQTHLFLTLKKKRRNLLVD